MKDFMGNAHKKDFKDQKKKKNNNNIHVFYKMDTIINV